MGIEWREAPGNFDGASNWGSGRPVTVWLGLGLIRPTSYYFAALSFLYSSASISNRPYSAASAPLFVNL